MSTAETPPRKEGLRARKRRATENAIEKAAVDLALELGVEHVTVEAVCERADISRSTFFNYFASRDYAIMGRAIDLPDAEQVFGILDTSPDDLARGLFRLFFAAIGHTRVNAEVAEKRARLIAEQPEARGLSSSVLLESGQQLIEAGAAWLEARPEHAKLDSPLREATLSASLLIGTLMALSEELLKLRLAASQHEDYTADERIYDRLREDARKLLAD